MVEHMSGVCRALAPSPELHGALASTWSVGPNTSGSSGLRTLMWPSTPTILKGAFGLGEMNLVLIPHLWDYSGHCVYT